MDSQIKRYVLAGAAALLLLVAAVVVYRSMFGESNAERTARKLPPAPRYFVDEATEQEVVVATHLAAPITSSDGKTLVEAVFVSCDNGQTKKLAYTIKYTETAKAILDEHRGQMAALSVEDSDTVQAGMMYRAAGTKDWVNANTPQGLRISVLPRCPGTNQLSTIVKPSEGSSALAIE